MVTKEISEHMKKIGSKGGTSTFKKYGSGYFKALRKKVGKKI